MKFPTFLKVYGNQSFRGDCPKEDAELSTFVNQVRKKYPDTYGAVMVHIKNEGKRTAIQAKVDRMHGQTKGASDINIPGSRSFILEMKRKDHTKSGWETGQQEYLKAAHDLGAFVCVALGWEAAFEALEDWIAEQSKAPL